MPQPPPPPRPQPLRETLELRAPVSSPYPWQRGEDAATWLSAVGAASARLDGGPLSEALRHLAGVELAPGLVASVGRARLLGELLLTLAEPGRICQGLKGTCAVTCAELHLADRRPRLYLSLLTGLLQPAGSATLPDGSVLVRDEERLCWDPHEGQRGPLSRLFQAAAMELAVPAADYDNGLDRMMAPDGRVEATAGLDLRAFDHLLEALTGQTWAVLTDGQAALVAALGLDPATVGDLSRDAPAILRATVDAGDVCFATLAAHGPPAPTPEMRALLAQPHKVRVYGFDGAWVTYDDPVDPTHPWLVGGGGELIDTYGRCRMAADDFLGALVELSYRPHHLRLPGGPPVSSPG